MHSREKISSSTHQNTDTCFPNQQTFTIQTLGETTGRNLPPTGRNLHNKKEPQTAGIQKGHPKHSNLNKMKWQRNMRQVKEYEKCPPSQTKEKDIRNLPEKEFKIIIIKMIQNLENKELQINNLETRIEKMQEMFNKDLEEIKESIKNEKCNK